MHGSIMVSILRRWGWLVALVAITFFLPDLYPDSRPLNVFFRGKGFFITWGVILGVWGLCKVVRRYLRARYPHSPPVSKSTFFGVALMVVLFLVMVYVDEYYRVHPVSDNFLLRVYLFLFGSKRFLVTLPLIGWLIFIWSQSRQHKQQHTRNP